MKISWYLVLSKVIRKNSTTVFKEKFNSFRHVAMTDGNFAIICYSKDTYMAKCLCNIAIRENIRESNVVSACIGHERETMKP